MFVSVRAGASTAGVPLGGLAARGRVRRLNSQLSPRNHPRQHAQAGAHNLPLFLGQLLQADHIRLYTLQLGGAEGRLLRSCRTSTRNEQKYSHWPQASEPYMAYQYCSSDSIKVVDNVLPAAPVTAHMTDHVGPTFLALVVAEC